MPVRHGGGNVDKPGVKEGLCRRQGYTESGNQNWKGNQLEWEELGRESGFLCLGCKVYCLGTVEHST